MTCSGVTSVNGSWCRFIKTSDVCRKSDQRCQSEQGEESLPWLPNSVECPATGCGRPAFDCVVVALRGCFSATSAATEGCNLQPRWWGSLLPGAPSAGIEPAFPYRELTVGKARQREILHVVQDDKRVELVRTMVGRARMTPGRRDRACERLPRYVLEGLEREPPPLPGSVGVARDASPVMA